MVWEEVGSPAVAADWFHQGNRPRADVEKPAWLKREGQQQKAAAQPRDPNSVLFVCTGNICRSAFASAYLAHLVRGSKVKVGSAGIGALVGHGMDDRALLIARKLGADGSEHRARQLTGRMLSEASMVLVFGPEHYNWIQENNPEAVSKTVAIGQIAKCQKQIVGVTRFTSISDLLAEVKQISPECDESSWIRDPYKRDDSEYIHIFGEVIDAVDRLKGQLQW